MVERRELVEYKGHVPLSFLVTEVGTSLSGCLSALLLATS